MGYFKGINRTILSEHIIRRIEAGKEIWHNKLVEDTANNNFDHVGTFKIYQSFTTHRYTPSTCQIYNKWTVHEHKCLSSCLSFFFKLRERERERVYKIGYKEKWSQSLLIFFLWWSSCGEYFLFYELIDFMLFLILAWRTWLLHVRDIFLSSSTRSTGFGSVCHEPCPTTNLFFLFFADGKKVPLPFLGSQPIVWLLPSSFPCQVTQGRSPSTNICS